jgi:hypothetical protein
VAAAHADKNRVEYQSIDPLAADSVVRQAIAAGIAAANAKLSRVEQIKKFTILPHTWEPGGEYLTPTNKLKRKPSRSGITTSSRRCIHNGAYCVGMVCRRNLFRAPVVKRLNWTFAAKISKLLRHAYVLSK